MNEQTSLLPLTIRRNIAAKPDGPIGWLRDEIDRLFEDFSFTRPSRSVFQWPSPGRSTAPALELVEKDRGYCLTIELPGIEQKDVSIELVDGIISVSGEKHSESEQNDNGFLISERDYGAFCRQVSLPSDVDPDTIKANMKDGILKIEMKQSKDAADRTRKIAIG